MNQYPQIHYKIQEMKKSGQEVAKVEIGPEDAAYLLKLSKGNRELRQSQIDRHVEAILAGNFVLGNDCAMISKENVLLNFHHRAYAIITAGKKVWILLRINCDPEEAKYIDTGIKRSPMDVPAFDKSVDYLTSRNVVIARVCLSDGGSAYSDRDLSNSAICNWVKSYKPQIDKVLDDFFGGKEEPKVTQSVVQGAFVLALLNGKNEEALRFAGRYLIDPSSQQHRHGTRTLQELRDALKDSKPTSAGGSARKDVFALTCIFLNAWLNNWDDPNSKELSKCPQFRKGKGYVAFKPIASSFLCPNVKKVKKHEPVFMFFLKVTLETLPSSAALTAAEIGRKMIECGYQAKSKNPERLASKKLLRLVKNNGHVNIGKGTLAMEIDSENKKVLVWSTQAA